MSNLPCDLVASLPEWMIGHPMTLTLLARLEIGRQVAGGRLP